MNIDLDSYNRFDSLSFVGEAHAASFQTYFYGARTGDIQPTQCVAVKCAWITCAPWCTDHQNHPGAQDVSSSDVCLARILGRL